MYSGTLYTVPSVKNFSGKLLIDHNVSTQEILYLCGLNAALAQQGDVNDFLCFQHVK